MGLIEILTNVKKKIAEDAEKPDPNPARSLALWAFITGAAFVVAVNGLMRLFGYTDPSRQSMIVDAAIGVAVLVTGVYVTISIYRTYRKPLPQTELGKILLAIYKDICVLMDAEDRRYGGKTKKEVALEDLKHVGLLFRGWANTYRKKPDDYKIYE